jgi:exodeoxyribonuclease VII large subunit
MTDDAPPGELPLTPEITGDHNVAEFSVGEIATAVKRTLEGTFSRIRVRGEISRPNYHTSGHLYLTLKDADAVIDGVCWRGTVGRLNLKVEEGMEVICTGRISSYPRSSKYQLVIESIELAGEGALLKLLEDRRKKLAAEGLFDEDRKQAIPFLPEVIGVVTSPTGAVIRDILHRLADRFPRHVLVWPVPVQGEGAAEKVAAAIRGFNALESGGPGGGGVPRPDVLIVARGGGSLEDLWTFNEEIVVRAAAESAIPLISAVGHETDTTLIDFASDRRAPTPTAAAEMAVPVRADLIARVLDAERRLVTGLERGWEDRRVRLGGLARGLPQPDRLLEEAQQRLDGESDRLALSIRHRMEQMGDRNEGLGGRLRHPREIMDGAGEKLFQTAARLNSAAENALRDRQGRFDGLDVGNRLPASITRQIQNAAERLAAQSQLLDSYSYRGVLERGFALVRDATGGPVTRAAEIGKGHTVAIEFFDGTRGAVIDGDPPRGPAKSSATKKRAEPEDTQGSLL